MKIYLVMAYRGEDQDYREWLLKAFKDKIKAKLFVKICKKIAAKHGRNIDYYWLEMETID